MNTEDQHDADSATEWLQSLSDVAVERVDTDEPPVVAVPLDRERPDRRPVVPRWTWMGALGFIAALVVIALLVLWGSARSAIAVPSVVGLDEGVARTTLERIQLGLTVAEQRFDAAPKGTVLSQSPPAGDTLKRGEAVAVIVSAGIEEFAMPDVVGDGLPLATGVLGDLGLVIEVERLVSEAPSDTVLSSTPAAGAMVRTGDRVRLVVAAPRDPSVALRPFRLDGVVIVIDPAPMPGGVSKDGALEVARRLEAMLGASGANAVLLRSALDSGTPDAERSKKASEASATVCVGISIADGNVAGRSVSVPPSSTPVIGALASRLGDAIVLKLTAAAPPVKRTESTYDPVLTTAKAPWTRVTIGSAGAREDGALFADPGWTDRVARAIYAAIGEVFGEAVSP